MRSTKSEESLTSLHTIEAEPSSYRPSRPRSISEAPSLSCKAEEPCDDGNHGNRPPSTGHRGGDRGRTTPLLSPAPPPAPPREEDDLDDLDDLTPPAPGIFNLDFDPMSFQCSPPAAIPGPRQHARHDGSKKGVAGVAAGSDPPSSSPPNGVPGPRRSPDLRGGRKACQAPSSPTKLRKSFKTHRSSAASTTTTTSASTSAAAAPTTRADVIASSSHRGHQGAPSDTPPPVPTSSPPSERCKAGSGSACGARSAPSSQSSQASALTDLSQSAQNLPDPGADRLVSSVSVLPPHPPMTSAARKLALALAESAQKASDGPHQRRTAASGHRRGHSYPSPPPQRQDAPHPADRTPPMRPSVLHLQVQYCGPRGQALGSPQLPSEAHRCPHPTHHLLPTHRCCESPLQEPLGGPAPNVSPLGSRSLEEGHPRRRCHRRDRGQPRATTEEEEEEEEEDEVRGGGDDARWAEPTYHNVGVSTPAQPAFCGVPSPSGTAAVYANTDSVNVFNFRTVLAETAVPGSVGEVLPRPPPLSPVRRHDERTAMDDVYGRRHGAVLPGPPRSPHYPRPDALPFHLSRPDAAYRHSTDGRYGTLGPKRPSSPQHGGELLMGGPRGQWERSDEGRMRHPAMRRARSFHAPHFSHYEIAEAEVVPPEALYYVQKPPGSEPPYRWLLQSDFHPARFDSAPAPYGAARYGHFSPGAGPAGTDPRYYPDPFRPGGIRHSQSYTLRSTVESTLEPDYYQPPPPPPPPPHHRHAPPPHRDLFLDRREAALYEAREADSFSRRVYQPVRYHSPTPAAPYEHPSPPADPRGREIMHTRSRSDPGNACLFSGGAGGGQREAAVVTVTALSPGSQAPALHVKPEVARPPAVQEPPARKRESIPRRAPAHEGPPSKLPQRLPPDPRRDQPPLRKVPSLPERTRPQPRRQDQGGGGANNGGRSHSRGREQDRLTLTNVLNSAGGPAKPGVLRRAGRSQSIKENRRLHQAHRPRSPPGSEPQGPGPAPPHRRTQSTRVRPTRYDHAEGYYATPKAKAARAPKPGPGYFPGHGCMSPHRHRLLSKALGQGPFYHAGGRSEAGVYE